MLFQLVLLLLGAAVLLALAARQLRIPTSASYVLGGMALAVAPGAPQLSLDPALILPLFLPPLLQSSAFFTVWRDFRANLRPILLLAIGCVAFTTFSVGWVMHLLVPNLPWAACFTLGAIVSPPDAVSASSVLEHLRIPRRLRTILEGESLVNDASGLVLFRFASAAAMTGSVSALPAAGMFVYVAIGGIALGYAFGRASAWTFRLLRDPHLEIIASFLFAWASYMAAEELHASGVLSTVVCGLTMGRYQHEAFSSRTRVRAQATWAFAVFVLEALVFILIGLSLNGVLARLGAERALSLVPLALLLTAALIVIRFVWVFPATYLPRVLSPALRARDPNPAPAFVLVIAWAGMRGVVSLAVALALPDEFPGRDLILFLTFFVILMTVLVQGTSLGPVIRALGIARPGQAADLSPEVEARAEIERAALRLIEDRINDEIVGPFARDLLPEFRERSGEAARFTAKGGGHEAERNARRSLRIEAINAGRQRLLHMYRVGDIHDEVLHALERELDLNELRLRGF